MNHEQGSAGEGLARDAVRLLTALSGEGACAGPDPTDPGRVLVRQRRGSVSVAAGRFRSAALDALVSRGLAESLPAWPEIKAISEAGRAHLKRLRSRPDSRFQAQHRDLVEAEVEHGGDRVRVQVDAAESPLAWLRRRAGRAGQPLIDAAGFEAGERLRRDLTLAQWLPGITVNWSSPVAGAGGARDPAAATDTALAARQRVDRALEAVGADLSGLLVDLCGFLKGLEQIERERGWPQRSAKVVVALALARLARHYGFEAEARGPERSRGLRAWRPAVAEAGQGAEAAGSGG